MVSRVGDGGHQVVTLGVQPRQRAGVVIEDGRRGNRCRGGGQPDDLGVEQVGGCVDRGQVEVVEPAGRGDTLGLAVLVLDEVGGVQAQQVVEAVAGGAGPVVGMMVDEVRGGQQPQQATGVLPGAAGECGGRADCEVRPRNQPQEPEQPPAGRWQRPV